MVMVTGAFSMAAGIIDLFSAGSDGTQVNIAQWFLIPVIQVQTITDLSLADKDPRDVHLISKPTLPTPTLSGKPKPPMCEECRDGGGT